MSAPGPVPSDALAEAIAFIEAAAAETDGGLPEELFLLISRLTPLVNVDLLIRNARGQTLLTWRHDAFYGPGWHIPGGIIRFKETQAERIAAVARGELGTEVVFDPEPLCLREIMHPTRASRGHFLSMLFSCRLLRPPSPALRFDPAAPEPGQWAWHAHSPPNLIDVHKAYRSYIDRSQDPG